eukprot:scaffold13115_cov118-Skeletonema_marinoi.AAC.3
MTRDPPGYDSYSKRNSRGMSIRTDAYSVSVNSTDSHGLMCAAPCPSHLQINLPTPKSSKTTMTLTACGKQ